MSTTALVANFMAINGRWFVEVDDVAHALALAAAEQPQRAEAFLEVRRGLLAAVEAARNEAV